LAVSTQTDSHCLASFLTPHALLAVNMCKLAYRAFINWLLIDRSDASSEKFPFSKYLFILITIPLCAPSFSSLSCSLCLTHDIHFDAASERCEHPPVFCLLCLIEFSIYHPKIYRKVGVV